MRAEPSGCTLLRRMRPALGTFVVIGCARRPGAERAIEEAYGVIADVQRRLSFQDPQSELSRLNDAGGRPVELSAASLRVLRLAVALGHRSGGRFNCALGGALVRRGALPDHVGSRACPAGAPSDVSIRGNTVRLRRGVRVTLDGIAKGYAIDAAVAVLRAQRVDCGWVNAGGDLRAFGEIVVPVFRRAADGAAAYLGGLRDAALATSAGTGRFEPAAPGLVLSADGSRAPVGSWSVVARRAWRADALTKVAALLPPAHRARSIARLHGRLVAPAGRLP